MNRLRHNGDGVIVVDKPENITSAKVVHKIKKVFGAQKAGHAGTLDPKATGVLVCCLNRATRLADFFLKGDKVYSAVMVLGVSTDTQDATGKITDQRQCIDMDSEGINAVVQKFTGRIQQKPPVYSALKHKGTPLYKLARKGTPFQKPSRAVYIESINVHGIQLPEVAFEVTCSSGTYIRTLCADIGEALGCGGHMKSLKRMRSSGFSIEEASPLDDFESGLGADTLTRRIIPMANALRKMPLCVADEDLCRKIMTGKPITAIDINVVPTSRPSPYVKVVNSNASLIAVLKQGEDQVTYKYCCVFPEN